MKKEYIIGFLVLIVLAGVAYIDRHQIKSMLGMSPTPTSNTAMTAQPTTAAMAPANNIYQTKTDPSKGAYLADFDGKTLYTFDKDTQGVSNCYDGCAKAWPAYTSGAAAQSILPANITVITRTDKTTQFAWKGMPLYYYATDMKAGDINGDGIGGVWHIVKQ